MKVDFIVFPATPAQTTFFAFKSDKGEKESLLFSSCLELFEDSGDFLFSGNGDACSLFFLQRFFLYHETLICFQQLFQNLF